LACNGFLVPVLRQPDRKWKTAAFSQYPRTARGVGRAMGYSIRTRTHRYTRWVQWPTREVLHEELYDYGSVRSAVPQGAFLVERENVAGDPAYQQLREEVRQQLLGLRDPETGKRLVAFVHNREELYEGPYAEEGPDLVVEWQDYRYWGRGRYDVQTDKVFEEPMVWDFSGQPLVATHRLEGILSVKAPHVRPGRYGQAVRMVDMAPLAFYLLGELKCLGQCLHQGSSYHRAPPCSESAPTGLLRPRLAIAIMLPAL